MSSKIKQRMLKDREKIAEMYHQKGMSLTDIAKVYGCSRQYAHLIFVNLGIERRDRQKALKISPKRRKSKFDLEASHDKFIIGNYKYMTDIEMARYLDKPVSAVTYRRLIFLGKKKIERRNFTEKENAFILKNYRQLTDYDIAKVLDRSLISVTHHRSRVLKRPKRKNRSRKNSRPEEIADRSQKEESRLNSPDISLVELRKDDSVDISIRGSDRLTGD